MIMINEPVLIRHMLGSLRKYMTMAGQNDDKQAVTGV